MTRLRSLSGRVRVVVAVAILVLVVAVPVAWWLNRVEVRCGIVTAIDQASLTDVRGFTLQAPDGTVTEFRVDPARLSASSFNPGHLREHLTTVSPVCVSSRPGESPPVAISLDDGPEPSEAPSPGAASGAP